MKPQEIRELTDQELITRSREIKLQMMHLRIQKATGQLENKSIVRTHKKDVARIMTILRERKLGIRPAGAVQSTPAKSTSQAKTETATAAKTVKKPATKKAAKKAVKKAD